MISMNDKSVHRVPDLEKIVSGGQTGVDRAALDFAIESDLPHGGWCPKGRLAEDAILDSRYQLKETPLAIYEQRTEWNVRDSDGKVQGRPIHPGLTARHNFFQVRDSMDGFVIHGDHRDLSISSNVIF